MSYPDEWHGVQCKGKDNYITATKVTRSDLQDEIKKALTFNPSLSRWILATTAPKDAQIERLAREISDNHASKNLFRVQVFGWEDLQSILANYPDVIEKYYPNLAPVAHKIYKKIEESATATAKIASDIAQTLAVAQQLSGLLTSKFGDPDSGTPIDTADIQLQAQIDSIRDLSNTGQPKTALTMFERLFVEKWPKASTRAKFRILTNQAASHYRLGNMEEAGRLFIDAAAYGEEDPLALTNLALGKLLTDDPVGARDVAQSVLQRDPKNTSAGSLSILASFSDTRIQDPLSLVPIVQHDDPEIIATAARWWRQRGNASRCLEMLERANAKDPDDRFVKADLAVALMDKVLGGPGGQFAHRLTVETSSVVDRASGLLRSVWESVRRSEIAAAHATVAVNLVTTLRIRNFQVEAEQIVDQGLSVAPGDKSLVIQKAQLLLVQNKPDQCISFLETDPESNIDLDLLNIRAKSLILRERFSEAIAIFEQLAAAPDDRTAGFARLDLVRTLWQAGQADQAKLAAERLALERPHDPFSLIAVSFVQSNSGELSIAATSALRALELARPDDEVARLDAAEALYDAHDWDNCADVLAQFIGTAQDSHFLRLRIVSLVNADRRKEGLDLLESLPQEIANEPFFLRCGAYLAERSGDLKRARDLAERYLATKPKNLEVRLLWIQILEGQADRFTIRTFLAGDLSFYSDAKPERRVRLARTLDKYGFGEAAVAMAYSVLLCNWNNPQIHLGYAALFFLGTNIKGAIPQAAQIGIDTGFVVGPEFTGGQPADYIIESGEIPQNSGVGIISSDSEVASRAIGCVAGDQVKLNNHPASEPRQVIAIRHKYVHLFEKSLSQFSTLFPDNNSLIGFHYDTTDPSRSIAKMTSLVKTRHEFVGRLLEFQRSNPVPLAMMAKFSRSEMIDIWDDLSVMSERFLSFQGARAEFQEATKMLKSKPLLMFDPLTFWIAGRLKALAAIVRTFGPLGITASAVEMLERYRDRMRDMRDHRQGVMAMDSTGESVAILKTSAEDQQHALDIADEILGFARSDRVRIVPAVPKKELGPDARQFARMMDASAMDAIAAASGSGRIYVCDDARLRGLAGEVAELKGVWLQPILMMAGNSGNLPEDDYHRAVGTLAARGHDFTSITSQALFLAALDNGWAREGKFQRLAALLSDPRLDPVSIAHILPVFVGDLWSASTTVKRKESLTSAILDAIGTREAGQRNQIVDAILRLGAPTRLSDLGARLRARKALQNFIRRWIDRNVSQEGGTAS
jgi:Flp pilus assembly protein TadD